MFDQSRFFAVQPRDIEQLRPLFEPLLNEFEQKTFLVGVDDVIEQVRDSKAQLWSYHDGEKVRGIVVTRIHQTSLGKMCNIWVAVGVDATELMDGFMTGIETWARDIGCYAIEIVGRMGWEKKLPGFTRKAVVLEKRLGEVH